MNWMLPQAPAMKGAPNWVAAPVWQGTEYWWERQWSLPWTLWALGLLLFVTLTVWLYRGDRVTQHAWQKVLLVSLRVLLIAGILWAALGWVRRGAQTDLPDLLLLLDVSRSMDHRESLDAKSPRSRDDSRLSRWERVTGFLKQLSDDDWEQLRERYNVKWFAVGAGVRPLPRAAEEPEQLQELAPNDEATRLGDAVRDVLELQQGRPTAAMVLFTDGVSTAGADLAEAAQLARRRGIPVLPVGVGSERPVSDLRLGEVRSEEVVFVNDLVTFEFELVARGLRGQEAVVRLMRRGDPTILDEWSTQLASDSENLTGRLTHRPTSEGDYEYVLAVRPAEQEVNQDNNRSRQLVRVRDETVRVLLVQDQPSYEYRFLKQLLGRLSRSNRIARPASSPVVNGGGGEEPERARNRLATRPPPFELTTVLQDAELRYAETDAEAQALFPVRREDLFAYDVVILSDCRISNGSGGTGGLGPLELEHLQQFVLERGGGLVLIHGPQHQPQSLWGTPLEMLLPYTREQLQLPSLTTTFTTPFRVQPTAIGRSFPGFQVGESPAASQEIFSRLPPIYWLPRVRQLKPGALVLAEATLNNQPEAAVGPLVVQQRIGAGQVLTHLFDESYRWRARRGDLYFERYWVQTLRYLSRQKLLGRNERIELLTDRREYRAGETVEIIARFLDSEQIPVNVRLPVTLERESGGDQEVWLQQELTEVERFSQRLRELTPGAYSVRLQPAADERPITARFRIRDPAGELTRLQLDGDSLRRAAALSRGKFFSWSEAGELWDELPAGEPVNVAPLPPRELWQQPWLISGWACALVMLWGTEWYLRKRWGLV